MRDRGPISKEKLTYLIYENLNSVNKITIDLIPQLLMPSIGIEDVAKFINFYLSLYICGLQSHKLEKGKKSDITRYKESYLD